MNNLLQAFIPLALAALTLPAAPSGYILDEADLLSAVTEAALETRLSTLEEETSTEFVIATVNSLQGYPIEDYALELGREWGVGQEEFDNGLILLVAPTERELRIEVGYGLEGAITDAQSSSIINQVMTPQFAAGSYEEGILGGVDYLEKLALGEVFELPTEPDYS
ncbi:MAG: TPM domain-containing protein [Patescibacteria group bacterium]